MPVVIVGSGLIGLATAAALEQRGMEVVLIGERRAGEASPAAAGMLAPGIDAEAGPAHDFAVAARERYPAFLDWLRSATGATVALDRTGIIQLPGTPADASRLRSRETKAAPWITLSDLRQLEPALEVAYGGLLHEKDGWVDNAALVDALRAYAASAPGISVVDDRVVALEPAAGTATARCASGRHYGGSAVVIAGGAWVRDIGGLPRSLPVVPVRGQMISLQGAPVSRVVFGSRGYTVPRENGQTLVGSTMERVGFDAGTTSEARSQLRAVASAICPAFTNALGTGHWSGLRPVTPDMHPIIGRDPDHPSVIYACGHSKNGILLAPLTADVVTAIACGEEAPYDLSPFSPTRFR